MATNCREFSPEIIYIKGSKNFFVYVCIHLDKRDDENNNNDNHNVEPTLESLSENVALNKEDILHPTSSKTVMGFQQKDKYLIEIAKEKPKDDSNKQFYGAGKIISCSCIYIKIVIPKQIQKSLVK